jgi:hypothetical protein
MQWSKADRKACAEHASLCEYTADAMSEQTDLLRAWGWLGGAARKALTGVDNAALSLARLQFLLKSASQERDPKQLAELLAGTRKPCRQVTREDTLARAAPLEPSMYPSGVLAQARCARNHLQAAARLARMIERDVDGWEKRGLLKPEGGKT